MKYLVLGSSGQVGEGLVEYIRKIGHEAIEFDIVRNAEEDLRIPNNPLLDKAVAEADFVFFLAFDVGGARYLKKYQETYDFVTNNQKLMVNTFEAIKKHGKKFIFASSQMSSMTFSNYGVLKNLGEKMTDILDGRVVKFWNVYGFERDLEKSHVITDLILKAHKEKKITLMTSGQEERQFLHVEDCAKCLITIAERYDEISKEHPLHITTFEWTKVIDVANIISENFDNAPVMPNISPADQQNDVQHSIKNDASTYILRFWKPEIDLKTGIVDIIKRMREHGMIS